MTGTALNGSIAVNDNVEIPILKVQSSFVVNKHACGNGYHYLSKHIK